MRFEEQSEYRLLMEMFMDEAHLQKHSEQGYAVHSLHYGYSRHRDKGVFVGSRD